MLLLTKIPVSPSKFAKFIAENNEAKLWTLVRDVKNPSGKGGDYYAGFKGIVKTVCQMGQDIHYVEDAFKRLVTIKEPQKRRLRILCDAFLDQWRKQHYQFFYAQGNYVTIGRLTLKMGPDVGVETTSGNKIAVRLWLSEGSILDKERDAFIYLMSEVKRTAQWPPAWMFGVWELERGQIDPVMTVTDQLRDEIYRKAEMFSEMWDALP